jgi:hypothetical protein
MTDLVTLIDYKEFIGIASASEDVKLGVIVSSVSALVRTYCSRSFTDYYSVDKVEALNIDYETKSVQLKEYPIVSITTVEERSAYSEDYVELTTAAFEYYLDLSTDSLYKTDGAKGFLSWATGPGSVRITYKAGYAAVPEDLKLAVFNLITYYHKNEYRGSKTLRGATSSVPSTTTQWGNVSFPDHIKRVLDLYKNVQ